MPRWPTLPAEPLYFQYHQDQFLQSRRARICVKCVLANGQPREFQATPETPFCPICNDRGIRKFDRLTIIAGRRFGKSRYGSISGVEEACFPNTTGWACAPTNPKLNRYVIPAFQQLIPTDWVANWNTEFKDLRLKNGSLIHFQTLEDPDQGRGQGLDWLWIDEVCELTKKHWEVIRPSLAGPGVAFFTTSPRGFDWVYDELYRPAEQSVEGFWGCRAPTSASANPRITTEFLARERQQMSDEMYRQEYEADFVTFQGAVYGDLLSTQILRKDDPRIKKILPEYPQIDPSRQVLVGIDTGADHPFGGSKLVATEFGFVCVGEYLNRHKTFAEHAQELKRLANNSNVKWAINKNERQPRIELAQPQHGIVAIPAENDQVAGIERVKTWLYNKQLWFIEEWCPRTVVQMSALRYADNFAKDESKLQTERVYKKDDELPDCIRYALMTWPELPKPVVHETKQRDLSTLPAETRHAIERMRRIENVREEPETITGDFWA